MDDVATQITRAEGTGAEVAGTETESPLDLPESEELFIEELQPMSDEDDAEDAASPEPDDPSEYAPVDNRSFGRFELLIEMGRGGMATLFLARIQGPSNFEKLLAIKKIHDHLMHEKQFVRMFLDEARLAAKIHHPNVATIFDMGKIEKSHYIAMEYVHGQNLTDILKAAARDRAKFPWTHAARIIADTAAGLHSAHELKNQEGKTLNVVHRDVSPQNILVSYDGNVKVVDFGIAFAAEKLDVTAAGTLKGKVAYMSPEQTMGDKVDRRTDIFALGIVLWECICVKRLFKEETEGATLLRVRDAVVPKPRSIRPEIPAELERIVMKALAKDRRHRYNTAEEFGDDLESLLVAQGQVIRTKKIEKMLESLFFDRRRLKDNQVKLALEWTGHNPIRGVGMGNSDTQSLVLQTGPNAVSASKSWKPKAVVAGAIVAVAIIALLLVRPFGSKSEAKPPPPPKKTEVAAMRPPPMRSTPLPAKVTLKITVKPTVANVVIVYQNKKYQGPLFQMLVPRSNKAEIIQVLAPNHLPQTLVLIPNGDNELTVSLHKVPKVKPRVRPRPIIRRRWRPIKPRKKLQDVDWE